MCAVNVININFNVKRLYNNVGAIEFNWNATENAFDNDADRNKL